MLIANEQLLTDASVTGCTPKNLAIYGRCTAISRGTYFTNSRDIKRRLEHEGWILERVTGSHHVFKHHHNASYGRSASSQKGLGSQSCPGHIQAGKMAAGLKALMPHYVAIVEDAGSDKTVGLWFPDLPGCFSAGDTVDEAMLNASEAVSLYAESLAKEGRALPAPRSIADLRDDPEVAVDLRDHVVALVRYDRRSAHAAE